MLLGISRDSAYDKGKTKHKSTLSFPIKMLWLVYVNFHVFQKIDYNSFISDEVYKATVDLMFFKSSPTAIFWWSYKHYYTI